MSNQKPPLPTPKPSVRKKVAHEEKAKTQLKEKQAKLRANIRNARKLAAKSTAELDTILAQRGVVDNKIGLATKAGRNNSLVSNAHCSVMTVK